MTNTTYRPFTVEEYHKMAEAGVFAPDERVELIGGQLFPMSPADHKHTTIIMQLTRVLMHHFGNEYDIGIQTPVTLDDMSEPEPDAAVVRRYRRGDAPHKPTAQDVFIVIEVSDTTLAFDREVKLPRYATARVPESWIINLHEDTITQYHTPRNGVYTRSAVYQRGDTILTTLGVEILADDILLAP